MPGGRPSSYKPEYAMQAEKLCELGATDDELAGFFGVNRATVYRWKLDHQEFCDALKSGKAHSDERVERSLYQKATGYDYVEEQAIKIKVSRDEERVEVVEVTKHAVPDTTAMIFWLKNRRKDDWRDRTEHQSTIEMGASEAFIELLRAMNERRLESSLAEQPEQSAPLRH